MEICTDDGVCPDVGDCGVIELTLSHDPEGETSDANPKLLPLLATPNAIGDGSGSFWR
jgi:hypothetical protein